MSESVNIGRTIARERRRAGVTQEALAAHLGVSKDAVSKWELGVRQNGLTGFCPAMIQR